MWTTTSRWPAAKPGRHLAFWHAQASNDGQDERGPEKRSPGRDYNRIDAPAILSLISSCPPRSFLFCRVLISCLLFWVLSLYDSFLFTSCYFRLLAYISIISLLPVSFFSLLYYFYSLIHSLFSYFFTLRSDITTGSSFTAYLSASQRRLSRIDPPHQRIITKEHSLVNS